MKIKVNSVEDPRLINVLLEHFGYSVKDINSYSELTEKEKSIISKEDFEKLVEEGD